jgi:sulfate/thiosulfate transport system substrate-binding protein
LSDLEGEQQLLRSLTERLAALVSALVLVLGLAPGCGAAGALGDDGGETNLLLAAYSTPREAYEEIMKKFQRTEKGEGVTFDMSFGASGEVSRAVDAGLPADVVAFSLEPDLTRLVESGIVDEDWNEDRYDGMVTDSIVVIAVRKSNPKSIEGWEDLLRPGVNVITPNPSTSGGAKWNFLAAYGAQIERGRSEEEALEYIGELLDNISVQDKSAREALQTFITGQGDAMIAYENEIILAQQLGYDFEYVIPDSTILIENPVAVVNTSENLERSEAFLDYLRTPPAQRIFGEQGYRPVVEEVREEFDYRDSPGLFTVADYGGWEVVDEEFFGSEGKITQVVRQRGAGE